MSEILADADHVGDALYFAALDAAASQQEQAFRDLLVFHRNVLNGGLSQTLDNQKDEIDLFVAAFDEIGLAPISAVIRLGAKLVADAAPEFPDAELGALTGIYIAAAYNLAYASAGYQDDADFPIARMGDQIERMALRYARSNAEAFVAVIAAAQRNG